MDLIPALKALAPLLVSGFGGYDRKSSLTGPLLNLFTMGNAVWTPKQYDRLAAAGFQCNVVGYKAVTMVSRAFAGIPYGLYDPDGDEVEKHEVLDLLKRPNPFQAGQAFMENLCAYYCLSGNAYVEGVDGRIAPDQQVAGPEMGKPVELYAHRPDRIRIIPSRFGTPGAYVYKANGSERRWLVDPMNGTGPLMHVRTFNPLDDWYGMSPLEAASWSVDQHNESSVWNKSLLQNGARPSGAMAYKPKNAVVGDTLSDAQYRLLRDQLDERMSGPSNAARPLILDGGLEWQEMGLSPKDMDWLKGREGAAREVAMAFGVPAQLLGIPGDNTYNNMQEAKASLYEETIIPIGQTLLEALSLWLLPTFGLEGYCLKLELDDVPALFLRRKQKWDMIANSTFLTINEKRRQLDYDPKDSPLADEILVDNRLITLDDLGAEHPPEEVPSNTEDPTPDPQPTDAPGQKALYALDGAMRRLANGFAVTRKKRI